MGVVPYEVLVPDTTKITRDEWLIKRRVGLGTSDVAAALGLSPWNSEYSLYCDKKGLVPLEEQSDFFAWKLRMETPILDWAVEKGWVPEGERHLMLQSTIRPWLISDPDMLCPGIVVEAKTNSAYTEKDWDEGIPDQYVLQAHAQMAVAGVPVCLMPVAFDTKPPREFWIEWDESVGQPMIDATKRWWEMRITDGIAPDPDGSDASMFALRQRYDDPFEDSIELTEELMADVALRTSLLATAKSASAEADGVKARLMEHLGNNTLGFYGDRKVCTWRPNKNGVRSFRFSD